MSGLIRGTARAAAVELTKLRAQRSFALVSLAILLGAKLLALVEIRSRGADELLDDVALNGFHLAARSAGSGLFLWAVLMAVLAAQSLAGEAERGQLRMLLGRPVSRAAHYLGRLVALLVATTAAVALDLLLSLAVGGPTLGFSDVADVQLQGEAFSAASLRVDLLLASLRTDLALFATAAVALAVSAVARQATTAIVSGLAVLAGGAGVAFVLGGPVDRFVFTTWIVRPFDVLERLTAGTSVYRAPGDAVLSVGVPLATAVVATLVGLAVFTRRDVSG